MSTQTTDGQQQGSHATHCTSAGCCTRYALFPPWACNTGGCWVLHPAVAFSGCLDSPNQTMLPKPSPGLCACGAPTQSAARPGVSIDVTQCHGLVHRRHPVSRTRPSTSPCVTDSSIDVTRSHGLVLPSPGSLHPGSKEPHPPSPPPSVGRPMRVTLARAA